MSGIRVNTGAKKIEVNDEGEYIILNFGDQDFPNRFYAMLDRVQERVDKAAEEEKEIKNRYESGSDELIRAMSSFSCDLHRYIANEIDALFGAETCRKVFGDIVPGLELFEDFFDQLMPFFKEYGEARAQRLNKYSPERTGNV
ncbi:MAG: hypothetical protein HP058_03720 [Massilimaliae sp.]|nr:hypothetical protein [Massiliimalia sp.]